MLGENHSLTHEFPEHLDTITQLTANDSAFAENAKTTTSSTKKSANSNCKETQSTTMK